MGVWSTNAERRRILPGLRTPLRNQARPRNADLRRIELITTIRIVGLAMASGTRKSKCEFRRIVASEPVSAPELETVERLLARFVALTYAAEHPDLFGGGTVEPPGGQNFSSAAVPLVAQTVLSTEAAQYE
jgi:hypothetical protein